MPWLIDKKSSGDKPYCVYKEGEDGKKTGDSLGCHETEDEAKDQLKALYASEDRAAPRRNILQQAGSRIMAVLNEAFGAADVAEAVAQPDQIGPVAAGRTRALASNQLFGQVMDRAYQQYPNAYLTDLYFDDGGALFAVLVQDGKLYRSDVTLTGTQVSLSEWREVATQFTDVPQTEADGAGDGASRARTVLREVVVDGQKRTRWLSVSCTAVLNRSGELDSRDLFDSFVAHAEETGEYPIRVFYHEGEKWRTGQADFLVRDGYAYITGGIYDDSELARAEIKARTAEPEYWGDSIGFDPLEAPELVTVGDGVQVPVYRKGINTEISTLPEAEAAALFTRTIPQEVNRMNARQMAALIKMYGDEEAAKAAIAAIDPDALNRAIDAAGLMTRASAGNPAAPENPAAPAAAPVVAETPAPAAPAPAPAAPAAPAQALSAAPAQREAVDVNLEDEDIQAIAAAVLGSEAFTTMAASLSSLTGQLGDLLAANQEASARAIQVDGTLRAIGERLAAVETNDEERVATLAADMPRRRALNVTYRPRQPDGDEADAEPASLEDIAQQTLAGFQAR